MFLDPAKFLQHPFDFLVVGGGTAGLVVATRLSEIPSLRIGVIEAGEYLPGDPFIEIPVNYGQTFGKPKYDWLHETTPQPGLLGRIVQETVCVVRGLLTLTLCLLDDSGKVLGGSSAICDVVRLTLSPPPSARSYFHKVVAAWQRGRIQCLGERFRKWRVLELRRTRTLL